MPLTAAQLESVSGTYRRGDSTFVARRGGARLRIRSN